MLQWYSGIRYNVKEIETWYPYNKWISFSCIIVSFIIIHSFMIETYSTVFLVHIIFLIKSMGFMGILCMTLCRRKIKLPTNQNGTFSFFLYEDLPTKIKVQLLGIVDQLSFCNQWLCFIVHKCNKKANQKTNICYFCTV